VTKTVFVISDLHIGSSVAMLPDNAYIYDDVRVEPSDAQKWLKRVWNTVLERAFEIAGNDEIVMVFNGDLIDGDHHGTYQLVVADQLQQVMMANDILEPVIDRADKVLFTRGTPSHVGREGRYDEMIAKNFDGEKLGTESHSHWHMKIDVDGVRFDFSHFSTQSGIYRNSGNAINQLAAETTMSYFMNGEQPPHYTVRSHRHVYKSSGDNFPTEAIQTPAFQLGTSYVLSGRNPNSLADIGMIVFKCNNGKGTKHVLKTKPRTKKTWTM